MRQTGGTQKSMLNCALRSGDGRRRNPSRPIPPTTKSAPIGQRLPSNSPGSSSSEDRRRSRCRHPHRPRCWPAPSRSKPAAKSPAIDVKRLSMNGHSNAHSLWPDLPLDAWSDTCDTLHLWTQVAGKVRLALTPLINHWWNVTFRVTSRGLIAPANCYGGRSFDIMFDLFDHQLLIATSDGSMESFLLKAM